MDVITTPSLLDVAWAAGFMEGEGFFCLTKRNKRKDGGPRSTYRVIGANQVNPQPLHRMQEIFGGKIYLRRKPKPDSDGIQRRPFYGWQVLDPLRVMEITKMLVPHLSEDRVERIPWIEEVRDELRNGHAPLVQRECRCCGRPYDER